MPRRKSAAQETNAGALRLRHADPSQDPEAEGAPVLATPFVPLRPKLIMFDFDGTLADCLYLSFEIINSLAPEFGHRTITEAEMHELRNHGPRYIMKNLGISKLKVPFLMDRCRKEYRRRIKEVSPFAGLGPALASIKSRGYTLGIVTSNADENVLEFLKRFNLEYFDFVHGKSSIWGKKRDLRKILKKNKLAPRDVVYIGDETRDIESAQANEIPMVAVTWGFNSVTALRRKKPDYVINTLDELDALFA